jgi:hypothetical protein
MITIVNAIFVGIFKCHSVGSSRTKAVDGWGQGCIMVELSDGNFADVVTYFTDEKHYGNGEQFIGMTLEAARYVAYADDVRYLGGTPRPYTPECVLVYTPPVVSEAEPEIEIAYIDDFEF